MKSQVTPTKYNHQYFDLFRKIDFSNYSDQDTARKFIEVTQYSQIKSTDTVVDFGCGRGDFCFYLSHKFGCKVIGIDYSKDAINISRTNYQAFKKKHPHASIQFFHRNNHELPDLKNIEYIFLNDVVEHMYDHEIEAVLRIIKNWGSHPQILIHTDNLLYLQLIRPIIDIFKTISRQQDKSYYQMRSEIEKLHVNLTYPLIFNRKMDQWGFNSIKTYFPTISDQAILDQLVLSKPNFLFNFIKLSLKIASFLTPSFYAIYEPKQR